MLTGASYTLPARNHGGPRRRPSSATIDVSSARPYPSSSTGESRDIVAFHVEEERAYNMALPQGVTLRHVAGSYCSVWLGVAAGCTSVVDFDDEEIYVWVTDGRGGRWELQRRMASRTTGGWCRSFTTATGACSSHGIGCVCASGCRCTG